MNFSVSSTNQNEYVNIYIKGKYKGNITFNNSDYFKFIYNHNISDIEYFEIIFEFKNDEMKNIISSFSNSINETYPQIYSAQMFYLHKSNKTHHFKLKNSFLGYYQFISGESGIKGNHYSSPSFKGKPVSIHIQNGEDMKVSTMKTSASWATPCSISRAERRRATVQRREWSASRAMPTTPSTTASILTSRSEPTAAAASAVTTALLPSGARV